MKKKLIHKELYEDISIESDDESFSEDISNLSEESIQFENENAFDVPQLAKENCCTHNGVESNSMYYFDLIFTNEVISYIVKQTNAYAKFIEEKELGIVDNQGIKIIYLFIFMLL